MQSIMLQLHMLSVLTNNEVDEQVRLRKWGLILFCNYK